MAIGDKPRYLEALRIGGGAGDPVDGGADFCENGDIVTDGKLTAAGDIQSGGRVIHAGDFQGVPTGSLVAFWRCEELDTLPDWSGNGRILTLNGAGNVSLTNGRFGGGVLWDGVEAAFNGAVTTGLTASDLSLTCWIRFGSAANGAGNAIMLGDTSGYFLLQHPDNTGKLRVKMDNGSTVAFLNDAEGEFDDDRWHFVALIRDTNANTAALYIDGVLMDSGDDIVGPALDDNVTIGHKWSQGFLGVLDEVAIWSKALSAGEVLSLYTQTRSLIEPSGDQHVGGNLHAAGNVFADGGGIESGQDGETRGVVTVWDGAGGNAPGCIKFATPNGSIWYLFVADNGTVRIHDALPTQNSDGSAVGAQF